jgi:pimeloyl-ACP methyl ester carboxylesterase
MNASLSVLAALVSMLALYLPTRTQAFTRVTIDGRSIRLLVAGDGDATVVFENGLGGSLEHWRKVQPAVSRFARTVAYDRAGAGLSDKAPPPRDGRRIAAELRQALQAAGIAPPYILVGHSFGGPLVRIFADLHPEAVAGLILVDPTRDDEQIQSTSKHPEVLAWSETLRQARASRVPSGVPVALIDAISPLDVPFATRAMRAARLRARPALEAESRHFEQWMRTIPGGRLIVTRQSSHNVPHEQPSIVIDTIREAVEESRTRRRRAP